MSQLLEDINQRLEYLKQVRCQVGLDALEALEEPAVGSLTKQMQTEASRLFRTKEMFQGLVDNAKKIHDQETHTKLSNLDKQLCSKYDSMFRLARDSRHEINAHGQLVEKLNHAALKHAVKNHLSSLEAARGRYLKKYAARPFRRLKLANLQNSWKDGIKKTAWHEITSKVTRWKIEQQVKYNSWLDDTTTVLRHDYGTKITELQDKTANAREAVGDLRALLPVDLNHVTQTTYHHSGNVILRLQKAQLNALVNCLKIRTHNQIELYLNIILNVCVEDNKTRAATESLIFDLRRQLQARDYIRHEANRQDEYSP